MSLPTAQRRGAELTSEQRVDWIRLIRSENVGPVSFRQLVNRFGGASAALAALPELARRGGKRTLKVAEPAAVEREMAAAERMGARFVCLGEPDYPFALAAIDAPPPVLAYRGTAAMFGMPSIGVVGSRNASAAGGAMTRRLAIAFGREGYATTSGLARGIDAAAHKSALEYGTIACMAGGLDKPFPPENVPLMEEIVERGGAVVSEMPFGWQPRARDFPRRNRLIAGLSLGVVVVEAAQRSGSLITARLANEAGRLVFAVPGSPLDPRAAGTNALIKRGAIMVTDAAEVLAEIDPMKGVPPGPRQGALLELDETYEAAEADPPENERERIVAALGPAPVAPDELVSHAGSSAATVGAVLLELELAGRLERHAGGLVSLLGPDA